MYKYKYISYIQMLIFIYNEEITISVGTIQINTRGVIHIYCFVFCNNSKTDNYINIFAQNFKLSVITTKNSKEYNTGLFYLQKHGSSRPRRCRKFRTQSIIYCPLSRYSSFECNNALWCSLNC